MTTYLSNPPRALELELPSPYSAIGDTSLLLYSFFIATQLQQTFHV